MERETGAAWPRRRTMPDLAGLDEPTRRAVTTVAERLHAARAGFAERYLGTVREHVPAYDVVPDQEVRESAGRFMDRLISELASMRVPDDALRNLLDDLALRRVAQGVPLEALSLAYQLGSREMLLLMDETAAAVDLPSDLLLAAHDSTWEFANEASSVFARIQQDLAIEHARFDAERRSTFARGVLTGTFSADEIDRDAHHFGLDPRTRYVPVAARAANAGGSDDARRAIGRSLRVPVERLLFAEIGSTLGCIATAAPHDVAVAWPVGVGPAQLLAELDDGFDEAVLALHTAEHFDLVGVVRLVDLGPRPLVLGAHRTADGLEAKHFAALDDGDRSSAEIEQTALRYLECDQDVAAAAERLTVHPNTVRYRMNRFRVLTGLDVRRTEDLVTAWWLLSARRNRAPAGQV